MKKLIIVLILLVTTLIPCRPIHAEPITATLTIGAVVGGLVGLKSLITNQIDHAEESAKSTLREASNKIQALIDQINRDYEGHLDMTVDKLDKASQDQWHRLNEQTNILVNKFDSSTSHVGMVAIDTLKQFSSLVTDFRIQLDDERNQFAFFGNRLVNLLTLALLKWIAFIATGIVLVVASLTALKRPAMKLIVLKLCAVWGFGVLIFFLTPLAKVLASTEIEANNSTYVAIVSPTVFDIGNPQDIYIFGYNLCSSPKAVPMLSSVPDAFDVKVISYSSTQIQARLIPKNGIKPISYALTVFPILKNQQPIIRRIEWKYPAKRNLSIIEVTTQGVFKHTDLKPLSGEIAAESDWKFFGADEITTEGDLNAEEGFKFDDNLVHRCATHLGRPPKTCTMERLNDKKIHYKVSAKGGSARDQYRTINKIFYSVTQRREGEENVDQARALATNSTEIVRDAPREVLHLVDYPFTVPGQAGERTTTGAASRYVIKYKIFNPDGSSADGATVFEAAGIEGESLAVDGVILAKQGNSIYARYVGN